MCDVHTHQSRLTGRGVNRTRLIYVNKEPRKEAETRRKDVQCCTNMSVSARIYACVRRHAYMHVCTHEAKLAYWVLYGGIPKYVLSPYFLLEQKMYSILSGTQSANFTAI